MRKSTQTLPGIARVYTVDSRHLVPNIPLRALAAMTIPIIAELTDVDIIGDASCVCETTRNGLIRSDEVTLKYNSATALPEGVVHSFVVVDVNGVTRLIGAKEPPYPIAKQTRRTGTPGGDSAVYEVEVTYKSLKAFPKCDILL